MDLLNPSNTSTHVEKNEPHHYHHHHHHHDQGKQRQTGHPGKHGQGKDVWV